MKNQYFGDINDYRKYGLLRAIISTTELRPLVAWMLTPDDGSRDGKFTEYLEDPGRWENHDQPLFKGLDNLMSSQLERSVTLIEGTSLLERSAYFSDIVPDDGDGRTKWFAQMEQSTKAHDFVFLDPDNGLEVRSRPYGRRNSSKYLYWREVESLWCAGKSLLIYQHFIREERQAFIKRLLVRLRGDDPNRVVDAFSTPYVVFLMALQPKHSHFHGPIVEKVQSRWKEQIQDWERTQASTSRTEKTT